MISKSNNLSKKLLYGAILLLLMIALALISITYFKKKAEEEERQLAEEKRLQEIELILVEMDKNFEESTSITKEEIVIEADVTSIYINSKEAYEIARSVSKKILLSDEVSEDISVELGLIAIYFGDYLIQFQGYYGSLYLIDLARGETVIKKSFNVNDLLYNDMQELIKLVEEKNN